MRSPGERAGVDRPAPAPRGPGAATSSVDDTVRGLFGRDSIYMMLWLLQLGGTAAVTPIITRLLGLDQFGRVAAAIVLMQVLVVLAGCGLQVAVQRRFADRGAAAAAGLLTVSLLAAALVAGTAVATSSLWGPQLGFAGDSVVVRLAVLWAGTSAVTACCLGLLRSQDRLVGFTAVSLAQSVLAEVTSLVLILVLGRTAEMFLVGQLAAQLLAGLVAVVLARPRMLRRGDGPLVRTGLAYALPLVPATLGAVVLNSAGTLLVHGYLGSEAVARYAVAATIGSIPILVLGALDSIWLPRIFAVDDEADRDAVLAASRDALFRLLGPVMVGLSVASPLLLRLWAPAQFGTEGLLFLTAVVIVGAVPYAMMLSSRRGLLARSSTVSIAVATLLAVVVDIGSNVVLLPLIGLVGAALATLAAFSVQQACQYLLSKAPRRRGGTGRGTLRAGVAGAAALASAALPLSVPGMVVRVVLAVACLVWFARVLIGIAPVRWPVRARRRAT